MPAPALPPELTARLLEQGMGPTEVARYLRDHHGIMVTPNAVSLFRKRHTSIPPRHSSTRVLPWRINREHNGSRYRHAILAWRQREDDVLVSEERWRNLHVVEAELKESGRVIDYSPTIGFYTRPARPVDQGIVREVDDIPRPATRGPYRDFGRKPAR